MSVDREQALDAALGHIDWEIAFVLVLDVVVFRWANRVSEKLDENRMLVTEKVFGFLIAAIAVPLNLVFGVAAACIAAGVVLASILAWMWWPRATPSSTARSCWTPR